MIMTLGLLGAMLWGTASCSAHKASAGESDSASTSSESNVAVPQFSGDTAYAYVKRQVEFGPRVPNTSAHVSAGDWMVARLKQSGAEVHEQRADLTAFDGTVLHARNIFARFNPQVKEGRLLLLAHYDTRPWADQDPDPARRTSPADGANDGASGVAVLLEAARLIGEQNPGRGIDILLVDAEDYGTDNNDESWALGARYFAETMRDLGWKPEKAILLDMVGGKDAVFPYEYFSRQSAIALDEDFRDAAAAAGYGQYFPEYFGGAVTDDHVELIKQGIPAIDVIEYSAETGFNPAWHTHADNLDNISATTLKAVGQTLMQYIYTQK